MKYKLNRFFLVFETALVVGLAQIILEKKIVILKISIYQKVGLIMLMAGGLFSIAFVILSKVVEGALKKVTVSHKILTNLIIHLIILAGLYYLYAFYYFGFKAVKF